MIFSAQNIGSQKMVKKLERTVLSHIQPAAAGCSTFRFLAFHPALSGTVINIKVLRTFTESQNKNLHDYKKNAPVKRR